MGIVGRYGIGRAAAIVVAGVLCLTPAAAEPPVAVNLPAPPVAEPAVHAIAHAIALTARSNGASLALELSQDVAYQLSVSARPDRIIIDLSKVAFAASAGKSAGKVGPVTGFRYGLFIADRSRIVLDLAEPAVVERIDTFEVDGRKRLIFHFARTDRAKFVEAASRSAQSRPATETRAATEAIDRAQANRQSALPLVVIDPGHGGIDGGAVTRDGDSEKAIVLALALAVRDALEKSGQVRVELTRSDDSFVSLNDRVKFAREKRADLMVSLHADQLLYQKGVRGASIYTVSEKASDDISARLAASENAADQAAGLDATREEVSAIGDILFDLTKRETRQSSIAFARNLSASLPEITSMHKSPLRFAGFRVLTAPDVPSVLIETGYLSSAEDVRLMKSAEWRTAMAGAISKAVEKFLGENATRVLNSAQRP